MNKLALVALVFSFIVSTPGLSGTLPSAEEALQRTIAYHDPHGAWSTRALELTTRVELSERLASERGYASRVDRVALDLSSGWFRYRSDRGEHQLEVEERDGKFTARLDGSQQISEEDQSKYRLAPDQLARWRDYFTYMLGLPMKLRDPGTRLDPEVTRAELEGRPVLCLRVTYDPEVGEETWYFYLDPATYALVGCRFYFDESANDGEYLVFSGEIQGPEGLRLPRLRRWHMNRDGEQIAVDDLLGIAGIEPGD